MELHCIHLEYFSDGFTTEKRLVFKLGLQVIVNLKFISLIDQLTTNW